MIRRRAEFILALALVILSTPFVAVAQQAGRVYRIGWLGFATPTRPDEFLHEVFLQVLREHGFVEGQNVVIERRYVDGRAERNAGFAAEFVGMKVDLLVTVGAPATRAAKDATSTIPIVMVAVANPERLGLVASLARPGGNVTGMSNVGADFVGKMLQIVKDALPQRSRLAILWDPNNPGSALSLRETEIPTATALGITAIPIEVRAQADLERAFERAVRERSDVLYPHLALFAHRERIVELAAKHRLPTVVGSEQWAQVGALMSYGPDYPDQLRRVGLHVVKILKGAKPADLPVEQPTKFRLVVNLKTATALGLAIPPLVVLQADKVIDQ